MPRSVVVSAADQGYFRLLDGLIASLEDGGVFARHAVAVLDLGLTPEQAAGLERRGVILKRPGWDLPFPNQTATPAWFKAMTARPFLPNHFPEYDTYLWIDADAWVQDASCLERMKEAAAGHRVALAAENLDMMEPVQLPTGGAVIDAARIRAMVAHCYAECFGEDGVERAKELIVNTGVFALSAESPVWKVWQAYLARGLRPGAKTWLVEQQALNLAILDGKVSFSLLPQSCNWNVTTHRPLLDPSRGLLCDPREPSHPIGILHLTDSKKLERAALNTVSGGVMETPLSYRAFRAALTPAGLGIR